MTGSSGSAVHGVRGLSRGVILRRVRDMMLLWLGLGGVCGACTALGQDGNLIGLISTSLAGMIVLPVLGASLGLIGGRVLPTLTGGCLGGLLAALFATVAARSSPFALASFGLILGGLIGGTLGAMLWWMDFVARAVGLSFRSR